MLLLSSTWHFHSCLLTTQGKRWAHFYEKPVDATSTKNHKKKSFLFPESNVAEASVSKVSTFTIINKIPQCDHRDIHFTACSYKVVFICPVFWLGEIKVSWKQCEKQSHTCGGLQINRTRLHTSEARVTNQPQKPCQKETCGEAWFFSVFRNKYYTYILGSNCFLFLFDP